MDLSPTKKMVLTGAAALGIVLGAAGVTAAVTDTSSPAGVSNTQSGAQSTTDKADANDQPEANDTPDANEANDANGRQRGARPGRRQRPAGGERHARHRCVNVAPGLTRPSRGGPARSACGSTGRDQVEPHERDRCLRHSSIGGTSEMTTMSPMIGRMYVSIESPMRSASR